MPERYYRPDNWRTIVALGQGQSENTTATKPPQPPIDPSIPPELQEIFNKLDGTTPTITQPTEQPSQPVWQPPQSDWKPRVAGAFTRFNQPKQSLPPYVEKRPIMTLPSGKQMPYPMTDTEWHDMTPSEQNRYMYHPQAWLKEKPIWEKVRQYGAQASVILEAILGIEIPEGELTREQKEGLASQTYKNLALWAMFPAGQKLLGIVFNEAKLAMPQLGKIEQLLMTKLGKVPKTPITETKPAEIVPTEASKVAEGKIIPKIEAKPLPSEVAGVKGGVPEKVTPVTPEVTLYHGTMEEFADTDIVGGKRMLGIHLTTDESVAKTYSGKTGSIKKYSLTSDAKVLDLSDGDTLWEYMKKEGILDTEDIANVDLENYVKSGQLYQYDISAKTYLADDVAKTAKSQGYDVIKMADNLGGGDNVAYVVVNKDKLAIPKAEPVTPTAPVTPEVTIPESGKFPKGTRFEAGGIKIPRPLSEIEIEEAFIDANTRPKFDAAKNTMFSYFKEAKTIAKGEYLSAIEKQEDSLRKLTYETWKEQGWKPPTPTAPAVEIPKAEVGMPKAVARPLPSGVPSVTEYSGTYYRTTRGKDSPAGVTFFTKNRDYAEELQRLRGKGAIQEENLQLKNPLVVNASTKQFSDPAFEKLYIDKAIVEGNDAVVFVDKVNGDIFVAKVPITPVEEVPPPKIETVKKPLIAKPVIKQPTPESLITKPPEPPPITTTGLEDASQFKLRFRKAVTSPDLATRNKLVEEMISEEKGKRIGAFADKLSQGKSFDEAINELTGKYPSGEITLKSIIPDNMIPLLEKDIQTVFENKPWKIVRVTESFRKALKNDKISRTPGIKGGSQYDDLIDWLGKDTIDEWEKARLALLSKRPPTPLDPAIVNYLRNIPPDKINQFNALPPSRRVRLAKKLHRLGINVIDALGIPKALKFGYDISMPLRQGFIMGIRHPISWGKMWKPMFQAMRSDEIALKLNNEILTDPETMKAIQAMGLDLYDVGRGAKWTKRPESMASQIAERYIPGVRMSARSASVAMNKLMTDVALHQYKVLQKMGASADEYKAMGELTNLLAGRGILPQGLTGTAGDILNKLLTSPRYVLSRFQLPKTLFSSSKAVRQEAWITLIAWAGVCTTLLALAKASGAEVELDPRSPDAYKIKIGNKRIDIWVGYAQIIRLLAQLTLGQRKTAAGEIVSIPRSQVLGRFAQSKESPGVGALVTVMSGRNFVGEKIDLTTLQGVGLLAKETLMPAAFEEMIDAYVLEGGGSAMVSGIGIPGIGVSTYSDTSTQVKRRGMILK